MFEALKAAVEERMRLARAATPWEPDREICYGDFGWYVYGAPGGEFEDTPQGRTDARYYAANDPAFVLRQCERDLKVLERHAPCVCSLTETAGPHCRTHRCPARNRHHEIEDLAEVYRVNLGVSDDS